MSANSVPVQKLQALQYGGLKKGIEQKAVMSSKIIMITSSLTM